MGALSALIRRENRQMTAAPFHRVRAPARVAVAIFDVASV
jgi:hypothetical protein